MKEFNQIAIIGSGLMGCGLAQAFAYSKNCQVQIFSRATPPSEIFERVETNLRPLVDKGVFSANEVASIKSRITPTNNLADAVRQTDFIVECVAEDMEIKQNLFRDLEPLTRPDTVYATNTSVMSPTEIAAKTSRRDRVVGAHFWNPPYLIPLVEVVKAAETSEATMDYTMELLRQVGKRPIRVNKDVPGFVANRLQHALWREAISIVERGIADAATVDEAIKTSFGMRLPQLAPMENSDLAGLDLTLQIHSYILKHLENSTEPSPLLQEKVAKGELGFKSNGKGWREWTPESMATCKRELSEYLIKVIYGK
ncbi:MAG: hbd [Holophagaceae bacterium]|nr:hbd [Holophagaceae bacterium]